jgi:N-acetylneuraminic acid mutarotase
MLRMNRWNITVVLVAFSAASLGAQGGGRGQGPAGGQGGGGGRGGAVSPLGRYVRLAPSPVANEEWDSAVAGGKLYLFGGNPVAEGGKQGAPPGRVLEYDPAADRWTQKKPMPQPAHHNGVVGYNGKIYVFGGGVQRKPGGPTQYPTNNSWEYDPVADTWRALAPMPVARLGAVAVEWAGKIYVMGGAGNYPGLENEPLGGENPHRVLDLNHMYDPATNTWTVRQTMPTPRNHMFGGAVNGKIYLIGGRVGSMQVVTGSTTDLVEEYDIAADRWGAVRLRMPTPRDGGTVGVYQNKIYVAGGQSINAMSNSVSRALEAYDPATDTWQIFPNLPQARHGQGGGVIGNRFHVVSGHITAAFSGGEPLNVNTHDAFEFAAR